MVALELLLTFMVAGVEREELAAFPFSENIWKEASSLLLSVMGEWGVAGGPRGSVSAVIMVRGTAAGWKVGLTVGGFGVWQER